ncbi:hypothetical protein D3C85_1553270 [compost metagenome]
MIIECDQLVERGGKLVGQLVHFTIDHSNCCLDLPLLGQLSNLGLQSQVLLLRLQVAIKQHLLLR